jgi:translation elongation factor EF-Tu-like GTPase
MGIFGRRHEESMDPQTMLERGHADMAQSTAESSASDDARLDAGSAAFRLTVADVLVIRGRGTVVTGVVESGTIRVGSPARLERSGQLVVHTVVAGIEKFRSTVEEAQAGENVGVLVPHLDRASVLAGDVLLN